MNLNPEHRTALIMPICNEDVDRVFAGLREPGVREGDRQRGSISTFTSERQLQSGHLRCGTKAGWSWIAKCRAKVRSSTAAAVVVKRKSG